VDGQSAIQLGDGGVGRECLPKIGVLRPTVGACCQEEDWTAQGELVEVGGIRPVGPRATAGNEGKVLGHGDTHAWTVLQFVVPNGLETGGEEIAGDGEEVKIEKRVAIGIRRAEFANEGPFVRDLGTNGGCLEQVTKRGERAVVFCIEFGAGCGLEQPGGGVVVTSVTRQAGIARVIEPI